METKLAKHITGESKKDEFSNLKRIISYGSLSPLEDIAKSRIRLISGSSNTSLSKSISKYLDIPLLNVTLAKFPNGEIRVQLNDEEKDTLRGKGIFIISTGHSNQSMSVNDHLMEMLLMADACRRSGASKLTAIIPCLPYQRSDKKVASREPIGVKVVINMLEKYFDRIVSIDLHNNAIQLGTDLPFDNLFLKKFYCQYIIDEIFYKNNIEKIKNETESDDSPLITTDPCIFEDHSKDHLETTKNYLNTNKDKEYNCYEKHKEIEDVDLKIKDQYIFVSPDNGAIPRVSTYAKEMNLNLVTMYKERDYTTVSKVTTSKIIGDLRLLKGKTAIIVDDMADTFGTMAKACDTLMENGVKDIIIIVSHGFFNREALKLINDRPYIKRVITSNTLPQELNVKKCPKIEVFDCGPILGEAIYRLLTDKSISALF